MIHTAPTLLLGILIGTGIASGLLAAIAFAAFVRRRSWAYFLVALALFVFLGRTVLAGLTLAAFVSPDSHHLLEHGLDFVTIVLLLGAIYTARTVDRPRHPQNYD